MRPRRLTRFCWFVLALNLAVILWGAIVRGTGSGAGCGSHWPTCNGEVIPNSPRIETLIEFGHRLSSGLALLAVVAMWIWVLRTRPRGHIARLGAHLSLIFILGEAAVGAALVLFELVAGNTSVARAVVMGIHLVNTFLLLGSLTLTARYAEDDAAPPSDRLRRGELWPLYLGLAAIALVGASGAISALGDTLFPATDLKDALAQDVAPTAHFLVRLRVLHPLLAVTAGLYLLFFARPGTGEPATARERRWSNLLALVVLAQFGAGTLNVVLLAPLPMQLVHLLLADLVWITLSLLLAERLARPRSLSSPSFSSTARLS